MSEHDSERELFFAELNRRHPELRADPDAWTEIEHERALENAVLRHAPH